MVMSLASWLGLIFALSEIGLGLKKRASAADAQIADKGSLNLLWVVIVAGVTLSFMVASRMPEARMGSPHAAAVGGAALFALGLAIRWYSIIHLGKFFTVNVAISADHRLIDTGPYRFVRHPSYTGALMAFLGLALCVGNWVSLAVMAVPIFFVFMRRMRVEEQALLRAFPDHYRGYMKRTKRLIPAVF